MQECIRRVVFTTMFIEEYIQNSIEITQKILNDKSILNTIQNIADEIVSAYKKNKKVLTAGNGGSADEAQHIASELVAKFFLDRKGLNAISLTANTSIITAVSNDYGYKMAFARQIEANAVDGDIFIALSTSGNSENIILALEEAKKNGIITVGLTGSSEKCKIDKMCDYIIKVPSACTPIIQEAHVMIGHIICSIVESEIFGQNKVTHF